MSDARLEAATRALFERSHDLPFEAMAEGHTRPYRREAQTALAAADAVMFSDEAVERAAEAISPDFPWYDNYRPEVVQRQVRAVIAALNRTT